VAVLVHSLVVWQTNCAQTEPMWGNANSDPNIVRSIVSVLDHKATRSVPLLSSPPPSPLVSSRAHAGRTALFHTPQPAERLSLTCQFQFLRSSSPFFTIMSQPQIEILSPTTTAKMTRIQSWQRGASLQSSEPHSPASATSRRHSIASPNAPSFDVRVMPAPAVPQVQVHLAEPRPVLYHTHSHVASLHSWDGTPEDLESRAGLRTDDQTERSTLGDKSWRARAGRMSRAIFGPAYTTPAPALPAWRALNIEKQTQPTQNEHKLNVHVRADSESGHSHKCTCKHKNPRRKRNRMFWCLLIILLIMLGVADVIFLNVRVLNPDFATIRPTATPAPTNLSRETATLVAPTVTVTSGGSTIISVSTASTRTTTSASASVSATPSVLQNCLSQFEINAPSNPTSYPCDTCFSALNGAPSSANAGPATQ
jgi:predicted nucleic acid-binding Zn ribbon protein